MRPFFLFPFLYLILLMMSFSCVQGQQIYGQPFLYDPAWQSHVITISAPTSPRWAYAVVLNSLQIWNKAQIWFVETWYPKSLKDVYTLVPTSGPSQITINYVPDSGQLWNGDTLYHSNWASIQIVLSRYSPMKLDGLRFAVDHELGHALGLGHTTAPPQDLMCVIFGGGRERNCDPTHRNVFPSTLNLYGVFLEAEGNHYGPRDSAKLPSTIPYTIWPHDSVPLEFLATIPLTILILATAFFFSQKVEASKSSDRVETSGHLLSRACESVWSHADSE